MTKPWKPEPKDLELLEDAAAMFASLHDTESRESYQARFGKLSDGLWELHKKLKENSE